MKTSHYVLFFSFLLITELSGQDYRTVNPDRIGFFTDENNYIKSLRIDSVVLKGDTIYYPFKNIQEIAEYCFSPYAPSWIGDRIIIQKDSFNVFFNRRKDSIKIKTKAKLGEEWLCYSNKLKIYSRVAGHDTLSFLGMKDSVKILSFQAYNQSEMPVEHAVNNMKIILSKNNGFVKTLNFYVFPDLQPYSYYYYYDDLSEYNLAGLTNPQIGINNLTWKEVYDFDVGDEIHTNYYNGCWDKLVVLANEIKYAFKYIQKEIKGDNIYYIVEAKRKNVTYYQDSSKLEITHDTITSTIRDDSIFNLLPGEPAITDYQSYSYYMRIEKGRLTKSEPSVYEVIEQWDDSCWYLPVVDDCWTDYKYIEGLGGPYYQCDGPFCLGETYYKLVYYKKGDETWGTPYIISNLTENISEPFFELYPNPVKDKLMIITGQESTPYSFSLWNLNGKLLFKSVIETTDHYLHRPPDLKGLCFYRIIDRSGKIKTGKLMFE